MDPNADQTKIAGITGGIFFICVGVFAIFQPDFFEGHEAFGRFTFIKETLAKVWGTTFGWAVLAFGVLTLVGTKLPDSNENSS